MYREFFKPLLDFSIGLLGFLLLLPLFILVAVFLTFANRGDPFFLQKRPGKFGRVFKIIKFKTMADTKDSSGSLLPDSQRVTKIGSIVRRASLDEIPQLLNVIKGDMSLIGPRPLLVEYLELYDEVQRRRHDVRPGITGWAQVNGRNTLNWGQKFEYDVWYVDHISLGLDCKIVLMTLVKVFNSEGVNSSKNTTMEAFKGN